MACYLPVLLKVIHNGGASNYSRMSLAIDAQWHVIRRMVPVAGLQNLRHSTWRIDFQKAT